MLGSHRNQGVGKALLHAAKKFAETNDYKGIALETGVTNPASRLYEREGWLNEKDYKHYYWTC